MKFIVIELQTNSDGTVGSLVYSYDERDAAESKYHTVLAAAAISSLPAYACVLMTSEGQQIARQVYHHVQEVEPEAEQGEGE